MSQGSFQLEMQRLADQNETTLRDIDASEDRLRAVKPISDGLGRSAKTMEDDGMGQPSGTHPVPPGPSQCELDPARRDECPRHIYQPGAPARPALASLWCRDCTRVEHSRRVFEDARGQIGRDRQEVEKAKLHAQEATDELSQRVASLPTSADPACERDLDERKKAIGSVAQDVKRAGETSSQPFPNVPPDILAATRETPPPEPPEAAPSLWQRVKNLFANLWKRKVT